MSVLKQVVRDRAQELARHETALNEAIGTEAILRNNLTSLEQELDERRQAAAGYDVDRDGPAEEAARTMSEQEWDDVIRVHLGLLTSSRAMIASSSVGVAHGHE